MDTIFTVKNEDLKRLNPPEAVAFFSELIWAEASHLGIGKNLINIPSAITVKDGGIDAEIRGVEIGVGQGIIKPGITRYQIKIGDFNLGQPNKIKEILLKKDSNNRFTSELKDRIKSCLEKNGTLVVVLFGWDDPEAKDDLLITKFKEQLLAIDEKYKDAKIEIWRQNNLIGFLKQYPSLALDVTRRSEAKFQTRKSWSHNDDMRKKFECGEAVKERISTLHSELRKNDGPVHVRVIGEPGIGKTKLVFESTATDDLSPLVIYVNSAARFLGSFLMNEISRDDNNFSAILVIDECNLENRAVIWNILKYHSSRIKLVTIHTEYDDTSGEIKYLEVPALENEKVCSIIQDYGTPKDQAERWSNLCSGSPRVAHVIGQNLRDNPEDLLKSPDTVDVWGRYIAGGDDPNSQQVNQRKVALLYIALFKRFGFERPVAAEAKAIALIVQKTDPLITWPRFQEIVNSLRNKKILQGEFTLYITPKALHIKLWRDWWNTYGNGFQIEDFSRDLPPSLLKGFFEMFKYAAESEVASRFVRELLGESGPFRDSGILETELGANFFLSLTEANPKSALEYLKKTIGTWETKKLLEFTEGRRPVIGALEKIAIWRELFADAARLLLALGEAENETWANNACGIFSDLFSPAYGKVAPTEASPDERLPILKEALLSSSVARRKLALSACDKALETRHFFRNVGAEYQGLRKEPELWMPKTWGELFEYYRGVWSLLIDQLDDLPEDEQQQAIKILLGNTRGLVGVQNLADMIITGINELTGKAYVDKEEILATVSTILHYDGKELPSGTRQQLEQIRDVITGADFSSLMRRYVAMDIFEDGFDEEGNIADQTQLRMGELSNKAIENPDLLQLELGWLVTDKAKKGYNFGYELGKRDKDFSLLPTLLEAQRSAGENLSVYFLSGYLRVLFETDDNKWEELLDVLAKDEKFSILIPELTWRSGISDRAALRVLSLVESGIVDVGQLRLFTMGGIFRSLSEDTFKKWIRFLLGVPKNSAISSALSLFNSYYISKEAEATLPNELTLELLTHRFLFEKPESVRRDQMDEYYWSEIGKEFVKLYPDNVLSLAEKMLEHFGEEGTILNSFSPRPLVVLNEIARKYPERVWETVKRYLGPPMDSRAFYIKNWLRGGSLIDDKTEGILSIFPLDKIWEWVDKDVEERAWYLASFVPKELSREKGKVCLAREVLIKYGSQKDVRSNLMANFSTEGWTGPSSLHYQKKKEQLLDFKKEEDNENVKCWIDEYVSSLDQQIERAKIEEERDDFR